MGDISSPTSDVTGTALVSISAKILIAAVVFIFFIILILILLHLYAKWYYSTHEDSTVVTWRRRTAHQLQAAAAAAQRKGLDAKVLKSLPVVVYDPKDFKNGLECAVCLSEVSEGEKARILPKCSHGFHAQCIDMWFHSHSTCPLCRTPVVTSQEIESKNNVEVQEDEYSISSSDDENNEEEDGGSHQATRLPTNVLFWGDETQVSSFGTGPSTSNASRDVGRQRDHDLVIEIPRELCNDCLSSPLEEVKSPMMTRLRSLKRLLSRGKRVVPSPNASSSGDMEQV